MLSTLHIIKEYVKCCIDCPVNDKFCRFRNKVVSLISDYPDLFDENQALYEGLISKEEYERKVEIQKRIEEEFKEEIEQYQCQSTFDPFEEVINPFEEVNNPFKEENRNYAHFVRLESNKPSYTKEEYKWVPCDSSDIIYNSGIIHLELNEDDVFPELLQYVKDSLESFSLSHYSVQDLDIIYSILDTFEEGTNTLWDKTLKEIVVIAKSKFIKPERIKRYSLLYDIPSFEEALYRSYVTLKHFNPLLIEFKCFEQKDLFNLSYFLRESNDTYLHLLLKKLGDKRRTQVLFMLDDVLSKVKSYFIDSKYTFIEWENDWNALFLALNEEQNIEMIKEFLLLHSNSRPPFFQTHTSEYYTIKKCIRALEDLNELDSIFSINSSDLDDIINSVKRALELVVEVEVKQYELGVEEMEDRRNLHTEILNDIKDPSKRYDAILRCCKSIFSGFCFYNSGLMKLMIWKTEESGNQELNSEALRYINILKTENKYGLPADRLTLNYLLGANVVSNTTVTSRSAPSTRIHVSELSYNWFKDLYQNGMKVLDNYSVHRIKQNASTFDADNAIKLLKSNIAELKVRPLLKPGGLKSIARRVRIVDDYKNWYYCINRSCMSSYFFECIDRGYLQPIDGWKESIKQIIIDKCPQGTNDLCDYLLDNAQDLLSFDFSVFANILADITPDTKENKIEDIKYRQCNYTRFPERIHAKQSSENKNNERAQNNVYFTKIILLNEKRRNICQEYWEKKTGGKLDIESIKSMITQKADKLCINK